MNGLRYLFISLFLIFIFSCALGQKPSMDHFSANDGLPSSEVYEVFKDHLGYLWFATDRGICKFDGKEFRTFTTDDGLCDNTVFNISEDSKGRLLFRTLSGKICMLENSKFSTIHIPQSKTEKISQGAFSIDKNDFFWINNYYKRINSIGLKTVFENYLPQIYNENTKCFSLIIKELGGDNFIAFQPEGPCGIWEKFNIGFVDSTNEIHKISIPTMGWVLKSATPDFRIIKLSNGEYVFTILGKLIKVSKSGKYSIVELGLKPISLFNDKENKIWIGFLDNGVMQFDQNKLFNQSKAPLRYLSNFHLLEKKSVSSIIQDNEHGFWFTTTEDGVYHAPDLNIKGFYKENGLNDNKIISIIGDGNSKNEKIYLGLGNSWINSISNKDMIIKSEMEIQSKNINNPISVLYRNLNNEILCFGEKIGFFNISQKKSLGDPRFNVSGKYIIQKDSVSYYVIFSNRISSFQFNTNYSITKLTNIYDFNIFPRTICIQKDTIWVGALNGLFKLINRKYYPSESPFISSRVTDIKTTKKNDLWIATRGSGVYIKNSGKIKKFDTKNGLSSNLCNSIFVSNNDTIWISTNSGLNRITKNKKNEFSILVINSNNGLSSNEVNQVYQSGEILWVATNNGLTFLNTKTINTKKFIPSIYINGIKINNLDTAKKKSYKLNHESNNLTISYIGLSFKNPASIKYRYRLDGLDTNWIYTKSNTAQFIKLSPGKYTFTVSAALHNGEWSKNPARVQFEIVPPFWNTWWFYLGIILICLGLIVVLYFFRLRQIITKNKLIEELNKSKQLALAAQMNPHFIFNAMNSIRNYILDSNIEEADKYLTKFAKLIRLVLDHSNQIYIKLNEEIFTLELYLELEKMRFKEKFEYSIQINNQLKNGNSMVPTMIIQPFIENAIWHGIMPKKDEVGKLEIVFEEQKNKIICSIIDNGIGREASSIINKKTRDQLNHKPLGIKISEQRLELTNSLYKENMKVEVIDLKDKNNKALGTKVIIAFSN